MASARATRAYEQTRDSIAAAREAKLKDACRQRDRLLAALKSIAEGLADTGSTRGQWMTRIQKRDAYAIAIAAIAGVEHWPCP